MGDKKLSRLPPTPAQVGASHGELDSGALIVIDERLESYKRFFDHDWARQLLALTDGTKISKAALDLCADWKSAANAFGMPWLFIHGLDDFQKGFMQVQEPACQKLARALRDHILNEFGSRLSHMKRKDLISIVDKVSQAAQEATERAAPAFQIDQVWAAFSQNKEFTLALRGCQRLCYPALYHAYENFVRRCVAEARGDPNCRPHWAALRDELDRLMPPSMGTDCLGDSQVEVARLARDTLNHNGGMMTENLSKTRHKLTVVQGRIEPLPKDILTLFDLLKTKVRKLAERARTLAEFQL